MNRILSFLILFFASVDIHLFVYPSLSRSLMAGFFIAIFGIFIAALSLKNGLHNRLLSNNILAISWIVYIAIHSFIFPSENYKVLYLLVTIFWGIILSISINQRLADWKFIQNTVIGISILNIIAIILQLAGFIPSNNPYFPITGCAENPSETAIYLTCCLVIVCSRLKVQRKSVICKVLFLSIILCLLLLKCRTAILGCAVILAYYLYQDSKYIFIKLSAFKQKATYLGIGFILVSLLIGLYNYKQGSSKGRLFIWETSLNMISEMPMGYGYGLYEKNYNLKQASLYNMGKMSKNEIENANYISVAYNDILEHGVEGGFIGSLFLVLFFFHTILIAYRNHDDEGFIMVVALLLMSMMNYETNAIQVWALLMAVYGKIASNAGYEVFESSRHKTASVIILLASLLLCIKEFSFIKAQLKLAEYKNSDKCSNACVLDDSPNGLKNTIGTSEAFYKMRAVTQMNYGNFNKALIDLNVARQYTSSPEIFYLLHICYMKIGNWAKDIEVLKTLMGILPHSLRPRLLLMQCYDNTGNINEALKYAHGIMKKEVKIKSENANIIKEQAKEYLLKHEK
ncbi:MAG: hypothetical protein J5953_04235 [Prevotella sp.]|nr:hypothetical protein [Prevotella sp.]